ncbi:pentapeptide repeat-containing protein [Erwinia pyrifoliae]|uniref:Pentapeptide repeat-containing protein n=1 Tax=Erwinia pyrifoliae TaxID=79967 RepID=A0ABY5X9V0_ERWPY|nr:pentapeptide repeat-containing protein [Erwinia pyrifoliae]MCT2385188.1 pentapeptide repeat-containing protein [Erwinia pyrifoliae]MCU8585588.1 pentapeptide repeat-containing protein [Erwinia pyrifoliae]UWS29573.1 pentapeptide repeat-containing protein [Erwinia pyrifoliae]UWS33890.1 pentapeptide repeat-containing protein [Erwinia pyrifoliae]UXK12562.1 pentapeptide repeat-containing protein [Erwinia pyrifoliae]
MTQLISDKEFLAKAFKKLDLPSFCIENSVFEECVFDHCNLTSAHFLHCKFTECDFRYCNLSLMEISASRFHQVSFHECKLSGVDWTRAYWPTFNLDPGLHFNKSILTDASFFGLKLPGVKMNECKLHEVDFRECDLAGAEITECDLYGSLFNHTDLSAVDLTDSWDFRIDVLNNSVAGAKFSRQEAVTLLESLGIELVD